MRPLLLASVVAAVSGHGAIISPRSRNSVDYLVGVNTPKDWPGNADCTNITGDDCHNGQADFYYSQGCTIGCPVCDHVNGRQQVDICGLGKKATLPDQFRSVNRNATAGSPLDIYQHNPWRAPGTAPVADACGLAGGSPWVAEGPEAGDYTTTIYAEHGLNGSLLPPMDTGVVWKIGGTAEVTWQVENNHGGGYSYRLCKIEGTASRPAAPTEACFKATQLDFVQDQQAIVYRGGKVVPIRGAFVSEGTHPEGSMWSMIPMPTDALGPRCIPGPHDTNHTPNACQPWESGLVNGPCAPCPGTVGSDCSRCDNNWHGSGTSFPPPCDGCTGSSHSHAIRDVVKIPASLAPGRYVVGWRYDCEATAQVWSNCADVTLAA